MAGEKQTKEAASLLDNQVGLHDAVLLDPITEDTFVENLRVRFNADKIYTYIGNVVVSVNPYRKLDIYGETVLSSYYHREDFEVEPHVYAIADGAFRSLRGWGRDQCIIISGESGAGKTEASKQVMHYVCQVSPHSTILHTVKTQLLESNPVLEAFGNAKTNRNDNSSRFGKYMDMKFNLQGEPLGGVITTYLLEKSRVVEIAPGEETYHVFYLFFFPSSSSKSTLTPSQKHLIEKLQLGDDPREYRMLCSVDGGSSVAPINILNKLSRSDQGGNFNSLLSSMEKCGFSQEETEAVFEVVAAILKLGNVQFQSPDMDTPAIIPDFSEMKQVCRLLQLDDLEMLRNAITRRTIVTKTERVIKKFNAKESGDARNALSKELYSLLFDWIVAKINNTISVSEKHPLDHCHSIGVLDIYGFEIFEDNSFEQFMINYCNEKLQQLFVQLTLKEEQAEYLSEGIDWKHIHYSDNTPVCNLIEGPQRFNIINLLEEQCRFGGGNDSLFLQSMDEAFRNDRESEVNAFYDSRAKSGTYLSVKQFPPTVFAITHYAGKVTYEVSGFVEKNKDTLYVDLEEVIASCRQLVLSQSVALKLSLEQSASSGGGGVQERRPAQGHRYQHSKLVSCSGTKFKASMHRLLASLRAKSPHYVRCINPNSSKSPRLFDQHMVTSQVRYLGLVENVQVRRAGFAYRQKYEAFVSRYKMLSPHTWPRWTGSGDAREATVCILQAVNLDVHSKKDIGMGKTKIFLNDPQTLFRMEQWRREKLDELVVVIQAKWRMFRARKQFLGKRAAVTTITAHFRMFTARRQYQRLRTASTVMCKYTRGWKVRKLYRKKFRRYAIPLICRFIWNMLTVKYLDRLALGLPSMSPLDSHWPECPIKWMNEAHSYMKQLFHNHRSVKYRESKSESERRVLGEKATASLIFRHRKTMYYQSVGVPFVGDSLGVSQLVADSTIPYQEDIRFSQIVSVYNRNDAKRVLQGVNRVLVIGSGHVWFLDTKKQPRPAVKDCLSLFNLRSLSCSPYNDGVLLIRTVARSKDRKGLKRTKDTSDILISTENLIEVVTRLHIEFTTLTKMKVPIEILPSFSVNLSEKHLQMRFERRQQILEVLSTNGGDISPVDEISGEIPREMYDSHLIDPDILNESTEEQEFIAENGQFHRGSDTALSRAKNTITVITS